jgi:hypothetical protein
MSMIDDMAKHFDTRLHQLVLDTFDTCESGGMSTRATAEMLVAVLLAETVLGMVSMGYGEVQCAEIVTSAHRKIAQVFNQRKRKPRARAGT